MARPRLSAGLVPARRRIIDAFWELYKRMPIEQVTVTRIAADANVNRATFYRYFRDVYDVLEQLEDELIPVEIPSIALAALQNRTLEKTVMRFIKLNRRRIERIGVLLGQHGDPVFTRRVKDTMADAWLKVLECDPEAITIDQRLRIEFIVSGILGALTYYADKDEPLDLDDTIPHLYHIGVELFLPYLLDFKTELQTKAPAPKHPRPSRLTLSPPCPSPRPSRLKHPARHPGLDPGSRRVIAGWPHGCRMRLQC